MDMFTHMTDTYSRRWKPNSRTALPHGRQTIGRISGAAARRLRSAGGETITEVLVALLVAALGILLFAGMVIASSHIAERSESSYNKYISQRNRVESRDESTEVKKDGTVTVQERDDSGTAQPDKSFTENVMFYSAGDYFAYDPKPDTDTAQTGDAGE